MPFTLKSLTGDPVPVPSVAEAQDLLAAAKQAQAEQERRAREDAKAHAKAIEALVRAETPRVADLEHRLAEAMAADPGPVPHLGVRQLARLYLRGNVIPPELWSAEAVIGSRDEHTARLHGLVVEAAAMLARLSDTTAEVWLDADHDLVQRADLCELTAWAAFIGRVCEIAGESTRPATQPVPVVSGRRGRRGPT